MTIRGIVFCGIVNGDPCCRMALHAAYGKRGRANTATVWSISHIPLLKKFFGDSFVIENTHFTVNPGTYLNYELKLNT